MNLRELRMLKTLTEYQEVTVRDMRTLIGALNPAQVVHTLRQKGWDINTSYFQVKDRDGKVCNPGAYSMPPQEQEKARLEIERAKGVATTTPKAKDVLKKQSKKTSKPNDTKGGENDNSSL